MKVFKIKRHDTAPALVVRLLDEREEPVELTDLNEIKFIMRERFYYEQENEQLKVQNSRNISIAAQDGPDGRGKFQYNWQSSDTDTPGNYTGEFQITLNGIENGSAEPFIFEDGMILNLKVDGGSLQLFTFQESDFENLKVATAAEIKAVLDATISGARVTLSDGGKRLLIQTLDTSLEGNVQITGGTANSVLLFDTSLKQNRRISLPEKGLFCQVLGDLDEN